MRSLLAILLLLGYSAVAQGQDRHWTHPDFIQLQYAGSIGYLSGGPGYDIFKGHGRASIHFGHVPKNKGGPLNIFSARVMFVPGTYVLNEKVIVSPFDIGLMVSYHLGSNFNSTWPDHRYPANYYWWQTSFRFHLDYQPSVTFRLRDHTVFKKLTAYVDVNANELYLVSMFQNLKTIRPDDVFMLGLGVRLHY